MSVPFTCTDCKRGFSLVTELQIRRRREAGDRCPTCSHNHAGSQFIGFAPRRPR